MDESSFDPADVDGAGSEGFDDLAQWQVLRRRSSIPASALGAWSSLKISRAMFSDYGPFADSEETSKRGEPLPYAAPPSGLFPDER